MEHRICPWYIGYLLASPIRKLIQDPLKILGPFVKDGMKVLEVGPGMGFFSLPMARLVGAAGKIYSVDLQEKMLRSLRKRAEKNNLGHIIEARQCSESSLKVKDLSGTIDFALAFAVVHEIPDKKNLFQELHSSLRQGGLLLISEPKEHVSKETFQEFLALTKTIGFTVVDMPSIRGGISAVLKK